VGTNPQAYADVSNCGARFLNALQFLLFDEQTAPRRGDLFGGDLVQNGDRRYRHASPMPISGRLDDRLADAIAAPSRGRAVYRSTEKPHNELIQGAEPQAGSLPQTRASGALLAA